jgi:predicted small metal-binding protein
MDPYLRNLGGRHGERQAPTTGSYEMHEFVCGHEECSSEITESDSDGLMRRVAEHLKDSHDIDKASETLMSYLEATCVTEMHEFVCGHEECRSEITESDRDDLMRRVAEHLKESHNIDKASETLMTYLETTCVTAR